MPRFARSLRIEIRDRLTLDLDRARVGNVSAGDHLDQRRLARAVFADQSVNLTLAQVERNALERFDTGECLADLGELEQR